MAIDIGQGLGIDEETLDMVVVDQQVMQRELLESDDPADRVVAALVMGDTARAAAELGSSDQLGFRGSVLTAELAQAEGRYADAITMYTAILGDPALSDPRRAVAMQHLGKTLWRAGELDRAHGMLHAALDLRSRIRAPVDQLRSTRAALRRVQADLGAHSGPTRPGQ